MTLPSGSTVERLKTLERQLRALRARMDQEGWRSFSPGALDVDLGVLANAAVNVGFLAQDANRDGKALCPHWGTAGGRRDAGTIRTPDATSFPQFARLPAELRLKIWEAAAAPPTCLRQFAILEAAHAAATATTPGKDKKATTPDDKTKEAAPERLRYTDAYSPGPAGLLVLGAGHDGGLWGACTESRRVVQAAHARAYERLVAASASASAVASSRMLASFGRRLHQLDGAARAYWRQAGGVCFQAGELVRAEHGLRTRAGTDGGPEQLPMQAWPEETETEAPHLVLQDALRYLFTGYYGTFPQGAHDRPMAVASLGRLHYELQLRRLLGVAGWGWP